MSEPLTAEVFLRVLREEIEAYTARNYGRPPRAAMITRTHWDRIKEGIDAELKKLNPTRMLDDGPAPARSCIRADGSAEINLEIHGVLLLVLEDKGVALV